MASTEIQTVTMSQGTSRDLAKLPELEKILTGETEIGPDEAQAADDPAEVSRQILMEILSCETEDELEMFGQAEGWRDLAARSVAHNGLPAGPGVPVLIRGFRWRRSEFTDGGGFPLYFLVEAVRVDTGRPVVLTTGAGNVMAQLIVLARLQKLPCVRVATEPEKPTSRGYWPLWLQSVTDKHPLKAEADSLLVDGQAVEVEAGEEE